MSLNLYDSFCYPFLNSNLIFELSYALLSMQYVYIHV